MSAIVRRPGATRRIFGIEFTVIDAVATSPCSPPRDLLRDPRMPFDGDGVERLGRAEVRFHVQRDQRLALDPADAVLNEAADVAGIDGEQLALDRLVGDLRRRSRR